MLVSHQGAKLTVATYENSRVELHYLVLSLKIQAQHFLVRLGPIPTFIVGRSLQKLTYAVIGQDRHIQQLFNDFTHDPIHLYVVVQKLNYMYLYSYAEILGKIINTNNVPMCMNSHVLMGMTCMRKQWCPGCFPAPVNIAWERD